MILQEAGEICGGTEAKIGRDHLKGQRGEFDLLACGMQGALPDDVCGCQVLNLLADAREMGRGNAQILCIVCHWLPAFVLARDLGTEGAHEAQSGGGARIGRRIEQEATEPDRQQSGMGAGGFVAKGAGGLEFTRHAFETTSNFALGLHIADAEQAVLRWEAKAVSSRKGKSQDVTLLAQIEAEQCARRNPQQIVRADTATVALQERPPLPARDPDQEVIGEIVQQFQTPWRAAHEIGQRGNLQ
jgi:hypothetical protein